MQTVIAELGSCKRHIACSYRLADHSRCRCQLHHSYNVLRKASCAQSWPKAHLLAWHRRRGLSPRPRPESAQLSGWGTASAAEPVASTQWQTGLHPRCSALLACSHQGTSKQARQHCQALCATCGRHPKLQQCWCHLMQHQVVWTKASVCAAAGCLQSNCARIGNSCLHLHLRHHASLLLKCTWLGLRTAKENHAAIMPACPYNVKLLRWLSAPSASRARRSRCQVRQSQEGLAWRFVATKRLQEAKLMQTCQ